MTRVEAVIFDWGGTLSVYADVDMLDLWRACADRLAPDQADELCLRLVEVEQRHGPGQRPISAAPASPS